VDDDDKSVFPRTVDFVNKNNIDSVQFMIFTPIPGTPVYDEFKRDGRILHSDWSLYDGMHCVHQPKQMSPYELQTGTIDAYREFYSYAKAMNEAMNVFFDYSINSVRSLYTRVYSRSFNRFFYRMIGSKIIRSWIKTEKEFLRNLRAYHHI